MPAKLLVLAPLRIEALALSGPPAGPAVLVVRRIGMGPAKAGVSAASAASAASTGAAKAVGGPPGRALVDAGASGHPAVAVAGLSGGLAPGLAPGDLVVADRLTRPDGTEVARLPSAPLIAGDLRRAGLSARVGTIVTTDHIVTGEERSRLASLGALVVDMESTAVAESLGQERPFAVLRAVSDTAQAELFSPAGLAGVVRGLRALRAARPSLARWAATLGPKEVLLAEPRSFCAGVQRAIDTVELALARYGTPVYVRRQIVHNSYVVHKLEAAGAVFVEELDQVPDGATVVFSAHGVGQAVREEAAQRRMATIDATCPLVSKVHTEARRFAAAGRQVILVGHAGHDEVEGTLGTVPGSFLVERPGDVELLDLDRSAPAAVVTQTTLATDEVQSVLDALAERFIDLARPSASDICYASQNRQEAVRRLAADCDLVIVVGSANSSNSNRLVEVAQRCGAESHLVEDASEVHLSWLAGTRRVGITAGASAPDHLVTELVECLGGLGPLTVAPRVGANEHVSFPLPQEVR
jgi:4-hydroxy-3-methylbut-2-enyl diphosphate reductase